MNDARGALLTFAFVSESLKQHNDVLVGLSPLFRSIAVARSGELFDPEKLRDDLRARYGMTVTSDVAEVFAPRLATAGIVERLTTSNEVIAYKWVDTAPIDESFDASNYERQIDLLSAAALQFADENPSLLTWHLDSDTALGLIFDWIIDQDSSVRHAQQIYDNDLDGNDGRPPKKLKTEQEYFCSRFFDWMLENDEDLHGWAAELTNALIVSEVVIELSNPTVEAKKAAGLQIYLDAPLCLQLLNCSGRAAHESVSYLVENLKKNGANVVVFSHNVDEIDEALSAVLSRDRHQRTGATASALVRQEVTEDHLHAVLRNPESYLEKAGVQVVDLSKAPIPESQKRHFSDDLADELYSKLQSHYQRVEAAERDLASTSAIMRRRAGHKTPDFFQSKHVMICQNEMLVAVTRSFCKHNEMLRPNSVGPMMHTKNASALVWLMVGNAEKAEISRRQLVANCASVVSSAPEVVVALRKKLEEFSPQNLDQFDALVTQPRNLQLALDFVRGQVSLAVTADPKKVIDAMKGELASEYRELAAKKVRDVRKKTKAVIAEKESAIDALETDLAEANMALLDRENTDKEAVEMIAQSIKRFAIYLEHGVRVFFAFTFFLAVFLTSSILLEEIDVLVQPGWTLLLSFLVASFAALPIIVRGAAIIRPLCRACATWAYQRWIRMRGLEGTAKNIQFDD